MAFDTDTHQQLLDKLTPLPLDARCAAICLSLVDLTNLDEAATPQMITELCAATHIDDKYVAAVCVYPEYLSLCRDSLANTPVTFATVVNFPAGNHPITTVIDEIASAIELGADEIDCVIPYQQYLQGSDARDFMTQVRQACGKHSLKLILETGELREPELIYRASCDAIAAGADFIKTSTGKTPTGATLAAAASMLMAINDNGNACGIKFSGGIRTLADANHYLALTQNILGKDKLTPATCRIGASSLLADLKRFL
ncbi:MAG: deoxyribose-phosphate aldolase [Legionellales bacterium]|nr:deoxyribose-phosphate aldolase [Legionellales bacterium]|tara:strand:- start:1359 stop:2129 length:771 start_codon:yes stop_codon:yes gene_type:complete